VAPPTQSGLFGNGQTLPTNSHKTIFKDFFTGIFQSMYDNQRFPRKNGSGTKKEKKFVAVGRFFSA
jgi:hypothetical protein